MFLHSDHSGEYRNWDDEELWNAYLRGRQRALGVIFVRYHTRLYQYGVRLISDEDAVKDAIQELFLKLWKKREEVNEAESVEFYLLLAFRRVLFREKGRSETAHRREEQYMELAPLSEQSVEKNMILEEAERERYEQFQKAMKTLSPRQQEILYLRLHHGFTNKEIARILHLSLQRIKNCIYEATKQLREEVYALSVKERL